MILREAFAMNHIDFIPQPRPEERAPEVGPARLRHLKKDRNRQQPISIARVSKDGHKRDRAPGHPSRRPREERGLLRMRAEGLVSIVRCDWSHRLGALETCRRVCAAPRARLREWHPKILAQSLARILLAEQAAP